MTFTKTSACCRRSFPTCCAAIFSVALLWLPPAAHAKPWINIACGTPDSGTHNVPFGLWWTGTNGSSSYANHLYTDLYYYDGSEVPNYPKEDMSSTYPIGQPQQSNPLPTETGHENDADAIQGTLHGTVVLSVSGEFNGASSTPETALLCMGYRRVGRRCMPYYYYSNPICRVHTPQAQQLDVVAEGKNLVQGGGSPQYQIPLDVANGTGSIAHYRFVYALFKSSTQASTDLTPVRDGANVLFHRLRPAPNKIDYPVPANTTPTEPYLVTDLNVTVPQSVIQNGQYLWLDVFCVNLKDLGAETSKEAFALPRIQVWP